MPTQAVLFVELRERGDLLKPSSARALLKEIETILQRIEAGSRLLDGTRVEWGIKRIEKNSPLTVEIAGSNGHSDVASEVIERAVRGVDALEHGPTVPRFFDDETLQAAKRLAGLLSRDVASIYLRSPSGAEARITQHLAANVDEVMNRPDRFFFADTSIDGRLEKTNVHGVREFSLFEDLRGFEIQCIFDDSLMPKVREHLGSRVTVIGRVKYDRAVERPTLIEVIDIIKRGGGQPMKGLPDLDITGGLPSDEYVRRLRDGE